MKSYRLSVPILYKAFVVGIMVFLTLFAPGLYIWNLVGGAAGRAGPPGFLIVPWLLIMGWNWWVLLSLPHEIRLFQDGRLEFVSLVRRVTVGATDLISIRPQAFGGGFYTVRHRAGKLRLLQQFDGFHELLTFIKGANPSFEARGC